MNVKIVFRDEGVGISKKGRNKLFSEFGRLDETRDINKAGIGLGLSICKELIHKFGGSIDVKSELGFGTDFIVYVPSKCRIDPLSVELDRF